jgi:hypothetical protein
VTDALHTDALRRDIARRLHIASREENRVIDYVLLQLEQLRHGAVTVAPTFIEHQGDAREQGYRKGWNDAIYMLDVDNYIASVLGRLKAQDADRAQLRSDAAAEMDLGLKNRLTGTIVVCGDPKAESPQERARAVAEILKTGQER